MEKEEEDIILHSLCAKLLKRGGHYFYMESREREKPILSFYPCGWSAK